MKQLLVLAIAAALTAFTVGAGPAQATTVSECQAHIASLRTATEGATFTGRNAAKDEAALVAKLDAASLKLDQAKLADAVQKLGDFRDAVLSLTTGKGKIDPADAEALIAGADDAIACVQALIDQSTTG